MDVSTVTSPAAQISWQDVTAAMDNSDRRFLLIDRNHSILFSTPNTLELQEKMQPALKFIIWDTNLQEKKFNQNKDI